MTQKEIREFLTNTKVYVNGKSKEIQEKLFSLGYIWSINKVKVESTNKPFLYIFNSKILHYGNNMEYFSGSKNREITAGQILELELTEPTYRPFKSVEECWSEMLKHEPFGWFKTKVSCNFVHLGSIFLFKEKVHVRCSTNEIEWLDASFIYENYTFADGTPFGIKEE